MDHKEKLKTLLSELFRLDQKDLDFGIYRVMRARADEIQRFLDEKLLEHIHEELKSIPAQSERLEAEREVYENLYRFFRRYYNEGDFISQRIYREGTYAIPYSGEEVMLHWANKDQYYVKSAEHLRDYSFVIMVGGTERRVHFKLVDVEEGEHGNVKPEEGKHRRFMLLSQTLNDLEEGAHEGIDLELEGDELTVQFAYRQDRATQATLNTKILTSLNSYAQAIAFGLNEEVLNSHINRYVARNTFDFFIHKDLGGFLTRELDHFVKTEVLELDDLERIEDSVISRKLSRVRALRIVAGKLIKFLASLEDFQKKLWLKKKFVVETNYCITLDLIPEEFYPEIAANEAQIHEWVRLFAIDEIEGDLHSPAFSRPLSTNFLKYNTYLTVDTCFFSPFIKDSIIQSLFNLEEKTSGVLINSENFQSLNFIKCKSKGNIAYTYIDPPYNAKSSQILYKNTYMDSSWLTLMSDRLMVLKSIQKEDSVLTIAIDEVEQENLGKLINLIYPNHVKDCIAVNHNPSGQQGDNFSFTHEYAYFVYPKGGRYINEELRAEDNWDKRNFRDVTGESSLRTAGANCFYPIFIHNSSIVGFGDISPNDFHPNVNEPQSDGTIAIYPIDPNGIERKWKFARNTVERIQGDLSVHYIKKRGVFDVKRIKKEFNFKSNWTDSKYSSNNHGTQLLNDIIPRASASFPKSIHIVKDSILASLGDKPGIVLDFFAGSGTTAHALIELSRSRQKRNSFIMVEMGYHFYTVLKPRIQKVFYSEKWQKGKPASRDTGISHCFKYIRLESYEDTLNNLELKRTDDQADALQQADLYEEYMLSYLFDQEAEGNALLSTSAFKDPTAYTLNIKRPGGEETVETTVDLIETFNWLIGLRVHHMRAPITTHGWHRLITGELPNGMKALIIWRKLSHDITDDNIKLNQLFIQEISVEQRVGLDVIYVNGCCGLDSVKTPEEHWKVELLDEHFTRLMFDTSDVEA